jgi:hypothetical protein
VKRQVYVIEGRRKGAKLWRIQQVHAGLRLARKHLRAYCWPGWNPKSEFRITTYVPKEAGAGYSDWRGGP